MKADLRTSLILLTIVLLSQSVYFSYSYSSTVVGDVRIETLNNGSIYCDSMICPEGTVSCKVTKQNDPNDFEKIVRHRRCLDENDDIVAEQIIYEENTYHSNVNMQVESGGGIQSIQGGPYRQLTPEEQRELEENLRLTQERVQSEIAGAMEQLNRNLAPFFDGSFAANLNNQIRSNFRHPFY